MTIKVRSDERGPALFLLSSEMRHWMIGRRLGWSIEVTLVVALCVLAQAFFSGLSIGARAVRRIPIGRLHDGSHASVYFMDRKGNFSGMLAFEEDRTTRMAKLKRLAENS